jgi:acetate kinase
MENADKTIDFLRANVPLFKDFPLPTLQELVHGSRLMTFEPNEAIIEFGEEGWFLGILIEGRAKVSYTDDSGKVHQLNLLKSGDIFGEMSVMTGDKTVADVIGDTRCKALLIPHALFSTVLITYPPAVRYLSKVISERSRKLSSGDGDLKSSALMKSGDPYGLSLHSDKPARLLIINCGSSSLKYNLFDTVDEKNNIKGVIERIGEDGTLHTWNRKGEKKSVALPKATHREAFAEVATSLTNKERGGLSSLAEITAIGHRVVHGGDAFSGSAIITPEVISKIENLSALAPLHNPVNLTGIREATRAFPQVPQVAVFDTSFHHTLPSYAYLYGLPYEYYEEKKIRRYGFHGMSHSYVALTAAQFLKRPYNELELVSCHLGNGASMCAVDHGRSVDTSMGLTPAEGLIMGTRCGDIDPAALVHLMRIGNMSADDLDKLINKLGGLKGLSGVSNDMREIEAAANEGNHRALLAFKTFCYRIRKYIGAYVAAMGGLDAIIFTGGIGQGSAGVRSLACQGLNCMGIIIDEEKNRQARGFDQVCDITTEASPVRVLVVPTDEERMIARETLHTLASHFIDAIINNQDKSPIPVEVSAHHVHLSQEHVEALFGPGHQLTPQSPLSQPGQFACKEQVNLVGPKGRVDRVRVLGPVRKATQVEISMTEQFKLGIHPPIRESGDIEQSPGVTLEAQNAHVAIDKGVICALRHIHMSPEDALKLGLRDKYRVRVRVASGRELIFGDVLVRVHPDFRLAMHIDTDEANAANITPGAVGYIEGIQN